MTQAMTVDEVKAKIAKLKALRKKVDEELQALAKVVAAADKPTLRRRSRHIPPECGTESGYQHHRFKGEERCDACKKGHAQHQKDAAAARKLLLERVIDSVGGAA